MTEIVMDRVTKGFQTQDDCVRTVIRDLSISFPSGSFTTLVGPNGCGKTTLLNLIAGSLTPDSGEVRVTATHGKSPRIGYVWQDYRATLLPWYNVWENIAFPLRVKHIAAAECRAAAAEALAGFATDIGLDEPVYKLSGGQQQLVSLLRSTVADRDVLLLDEPLSALDQFTGWTMAFRIEHFWMMRRITAVIVSHDVDEAVMLADRILLMSRDEGRIVGVVENSLPRPRNVKMLTSPEHARCRDAVIHFLAAEGAIRDREERNRTS